MKKVKENYKIIKMKKELEVKQYTPLDETIVIPDECGDSMWDSVLVQSPLVKELEKSAENKVEAPR